MSTPRLEKKLSQPRLLPLKARPPKLGEDCVTRSLGTLGPLTIQESPWRLRGKRNTKPKTPVVQRRATKPSLSD
jgi:hypothetical protein